MIVLVMGVAGSGKTTVGRLLAETLGWLYVEGDDFHTPASRQKMAAGIPLDDRDSLPWLQELRRQIEDCLAAGQDAVVACSALKADYREILTGGLDGVSIVHLTGSPELLHERLAHRTSHFMKAVMLDSQLATLEPPADAVTVDVSARPEEIVKEIRGRLGL